MVSRQRRFVIWWRRTGMGLRVVLFGALCLVFGALAYLRLPENEGANQENSLLIIGLVNLNILLLCVLAFLIGRNVVKLIFDRRRNILGSRLRMRLVVAFVGLTLLPSVILFVLARGLLSNAIEGWFSGQVERSVSGAVSIARHHFGYLKDATQRRAGYVSEALAARRFDNISVTKQRGVLEELRERYGLFSLRIVGGDDKIISHAEHAAADIENFEEPPFDKEGLRRARTGESITLLEDRNTSYFVRVYMPFGLKREEAEPRVLVATLRVDPTISQDLALVTDSYKEYEQLKRYRNPLRSSYILTLAMITGLTLFSAIWFGFYLARQISVPIQRLAEGMRAVSRGNYDLILRAGGDDEMGSLVQSFNKMTADLKASRGDAERRRLYIETILSRLAVGVVRLDITRKVTAINPAAARLFAIEESKDVLGKSVQEIIPAEALAQVVVLLDSTDNESYSAVVNAENAARSASMTRQIELALVSQGREQKIVCTAGKIGDSEKKWLGTVLLFDDITELSKAQHMAAWREVARRIAHEIKNPLTPIQISAQRLAKLIGEAGSEDTVKECVQTIVEHVDSIKRLANEFSHFARMPMAEFKSADLNTLLSDAIIPFAESHPHIVFQFIGDSKIPEVSMDGEQIRRILMNLLDNAIAALQGEGSPALNKDISDRSAPRVVVRTNYDAKRKIASFEVADNGPGIANKDKARIFEPYFTTKNKGTGLGLAIVTSIIADHQGDIRVLDNKPRGARFIVEIPLLQREITHRKLAVG